MRKGKNKINHKPVKIHSPIEMNYLKMGQQ